VSFASPSAPSLAALAKFRVEKDMLFPILSQLRTIKTAKEIELMRYVCRVSAEAHVEVMKSVCISQFGFYFVIVVFVVVVDVVVVVVVVVVLVVVVVVVVIVVVVVVVLVVVVVVV
jgi:hypothetical protein